MINWRKWCKTLLIIPPTILYYYEDLLFGKYDHNIASTMMVKIFGYVSIGETHEFVMIVENLLYLVLFNLLYGNFISEDFRQRGIYIFSRVKSREKWFYKKSFELYCLAFCYAFIFLLTILFISMSSSTQKVDVGTLETFVIMLLTITIFLTISTLLINLISLKFGNGVGFVSIYLAILILITLALKSENIALIREYPILMMLNPATAISFNLGDHFSYQILTVAYYLTLNILILVIGARYIAKYDISLKDAESY